MWSRTVRAAKASRCDFESRLLSPELLRCDYGVGDAAGDSLADGDGDSSAFFSAAFFFFGDSDGEADSSAVAAAFFLAVVFFVVVAAWVVVAPVVAVASSFFCVMQEVTSATVANVVIKNKMGFFIGYGLGGCENAQLRGGGQALNHAG